jgi:hypothetical protein
MDPDFTPLMAQMAEAIQEIRAAAERIGALSGALKSLKNTAATLAGIGREVRQGQVEQTATLHAILQYLRNRPDLGAEESLYSWEKLLAEFHSKPYAELTPAEKHNLFVRFQDFHRTHRKVKVRDVAGLETKRRFEAVVREALDCYELLRRDEQDRPPGPNEAASTHRARGEAAAEAVQSLLAPQGEKPKEARATERPTENPTPQKDHHGSGEGAADQGYRLDLFHKLKAMFRDQPNIHVLLGMHSFTLRAHDPPVLEGIAWQEIDEELGLPHSEALLSIEQAERLFEMHEKQARTPGPVTEVRG